MAACESLERALKESISYVLERFDGVEKLSDEQTSGVLNFIQRKDVLAVLQPVPVNRCCFSLFRVCVCVLTKWDTATIRKVQL